MKIKFYYQTLELKRVFSNEDKYSLLKFYQIKQEHKI